MPSFGLSFARRKSMSTSFTLSAPSSIRFEAFFSTGRQPIQPSRSMILEGPRGGQSCRSSLGLFSAALSISMSRTSTRCK